MPFDVNILGAQGGEGCSWPDNTRVNGSEATLPRSCAVVFKECEFGVGHVGL